MLTALKEDSSLQHEVRRLMEYKREAYRDITFGNMKELDPAMPLGHCFFIKSYTAKSSIPLLLFHPYSILLAICSANSLP